ncbi:hypothetical protein KI387_027935, partial [Taxus chinensis]
SPRHHSRSQGHSSLSLGRHNFNRGPARGRRNTSHHRQVPSLPPSWTPPATRMFG